MNKGRKRGRNIALSIVFAGLAVGGALALTVWQSTPILAGTAYAESEASESKGVKTTASSQESSAGSVLEGLEEAAEVYPDQWIEELRIKEADIRRREKELERKKLELETLRDDIEGRLSELKKLRAELQEYLQQADSKRKKRIKQLVSILNSADEKSSAKLFEQLEQDLAVEIISQMEAKKAAKVIDELKPDVMVKIIEEMDRVRKPVKTSAY